MITGLRCSDSAASSRSEADIGRSSLISICVVALTIPALPRRLHQLVLVTQKSRVLNHARLAVLISGAVTSQGARVAPSLLMDLLNLAPPSNAGSAPPLTNAELRPLNEHPSCRSISQYVYGRTVATASLLDSERTLRIGSLRYRSAFDRIHGLAPD